jgi:hypothetical protein
MYLAKLMNIFGILQLCTSFGIVCKRIPSQFYREWGAPNKKTHLADNGSHSVD